ncbi:M28 family metallopeptidase [Thalassotalea euphylliae]|uniref:M28 family metallopeptidase n=1 Tax=Thalassotalea euphylliae TaxID=1655234 RepID=UPI00363D4BF4
MRKRSLVSFIAAQCIAMSAVAATIPLKSIEQDITVLAGDEFKGRKVYTPELDLAADYIASRFKSIGLKPFKGSFKQNFSIFFITPSNATLKINGVDIAPEKIALATTSRSFDWDEESDVTQHLVGENDDLRKVLAKLNLQGGDHFVVVHHKHEELFKRYKQHFERGLTKLDDGNTGTVMMALNNSSTVKNFSAHGQSSISNKALSNVVGVLPGATKPQDVVLYTAHYDHLGTKLTKGQTEDGDIIYNGADDNASGVAGVINLAQYFAQKRNNARTLMFVAFTAEEVGGYGSKYFSDHVPADNVTAMVNLEMIGKESKFGPGKLWMTGKERSSLGDIMNQALRGKASPIQPDPYPLQRLFYRSDNATLARLGVPAHSFSTVQLETDRHYHSVTDEAGTINLTSLKQVLETLAEGSQTLVNGTATPTRVDTSKVTADGKIF